MAGGCCPKAGMEIQVFMSQVCRGTCTSVSLLDKKKFDVGYAEDDDRLENYKDENGTNVEKISGKTNGLADPSRGNIKHSFDNTGTEKVEILMGEKQLHNMQGNSKVEHSASYPQEVYKEKKDEDFLKEQPHDQNLGNQHSDEQNYSKDETAEYKQNTYDRTATKGYSQEQEYEQQNTEKYKQGQEYDQNGKAEYGQGQEFDGCAVDNYDQVQTYDQSEMEGYQGQIYSQGAEGYEHGQEYSQSDGQNPVYQGVEQEGYEQGQPYDQQGEVAYDQNQLYEGQDVNYCQDQGYNATSNEYSQDQVYDQTGAEQYDQNQDYDQVQGVGYSQGQEYTGTGEAYPNEGNYDPNSTNQAFVEGENYGSEGYVYEEQK